MEPIIPCLWFNMNAEEAMKYYTSVFKNSKINHIEYYPDESMDEHFKGMKGKVINGEFELNGQKFMCLDGGPVFTLSEAVSFTVTCKDQTELDYYWSKLSHVKESEQCGWCKDKFGLSWQIVPARLSELMRGSDAEGAKRVMLAVMQSKKFNIAELEAAYKGK